MIALLCVLLASVANAVMDTLKFRFERSVFNKQRWLRFCGPESWRNKWRLTPSPSPMGEGRKPKERFWLSSTVLVWTTDLWHLSQKVMIAAFISAILVYEPMVNWWVDAVMMQAAFSLLKEVMFRWVLVRN